MLSTRVYRRSDGVDLAGVEIAATAFSNLLNDQVLVRRLALNHGFLLLFGSLVGFLAIRLSGLRAIAAASGAGAVYFGLALFLFMNHRIWIPVALPLYFQLPGALFLAFSSSTGRPGGRGIGFGSLFRIQHSRRFLPDSVLPPAF